LICLPKTFKNGSSLTIRNQQKPGYFFSLKRTKILNKVPRFSKKFPYPTTKQSAAMKGEKFHTEFYFAKSKLEFEMCRNE